MRTFFCFEHADTQMTDRNCSDMTALEPMSYAEAVAALREDPSRAELVQDAYLTTDCLGDARRFASSPEFEGVLRLIRHDLGGLTVVDVGAGRGTASYAFASAGAACVYAIEPDPSADVGYEAAVRVTAGLPVEVVPAFGEDMPLDTGIADVVYLRQVMHHARNLDRLCRECARVLRPGGVLIASREHVVSNAQELESFLMSHPIHVLAGTEAAYPLEHYVSAIAGAGLKVRQVLGPLDSIVNAFPGLRSDTELGALGQTGLRRRWGRAGALLGLLPGVADGPGMTWMRREAESVPGRLYTFVASKSPLGGSKS